jgi:hypothetical protein
MKIEIDQSGKIEATAQDTVLAYGGAGMGTIRVTGKTKRRMQEKYREVGQPRSFVIDIFVVLIYLLIKEDLHRISEVVIDREYPGKEPLISALLSKVLIAKNVTVLPMVRHAQLGKSSEAHHIAIRTFKSQQPAGRTVIFEELLKELFITKNGRPMLKYQV